VHLVGELTVLIYVGCQPDTETAHKI
jgi:hypothetical protein